MSVEKNAAGPVSPRPHQNAVEDPPPYSAAPGASSAGASGTSEATIPGLPNLPYNQYVPASASISSDGTTMNIADPALASSPGALVTFLRAQAALPPALVMRVHGTSMTCTDFDVSINLLRYLIPESSAAGRPSLDYIRVNRDQLPSDVHAKFEKRELTLLSLAQQFCLDTNINKIITLQRSVTNLDESILSARVIQCLNELKYKGDVKVTFPIRNQRVRITPSTSVLDKFVGFFSKPREYAAVESVWPYAAAPPPSPSSREHSNPERNFVVRSEEGLWHDWRPAFERAVLSGRSGWVGLDDVMDAKMGIPGPKLKTLEWGTSSQVYG